jgi:Transglycosylase SLT domain
MTAAIVRLLPGDEHALLKAYVEGTSEPANAAAIYDTLEVPAGATPPRLAIAVAQIHLRELREQFGNLGLAAAAYNAGPGRVRAWLASHRPLPGETRNYVAMVTGWTADEWASPSPPQKAETTVPQGVPCTRLANLILAPRQEAQRIATYVPRWGVQLAAHLSESKAWALYRERLKRFASLIGDREPIVLHKQIPGMGRAKRYIITIASDDRAPLDKLCQQLIALDATCDVLRNSFGQTDVRNARE